VFLPMAPGLIDPDLLALQTALAGEYVIERELGRGGMGVVYLARDVELERPVAIKVLPPQYAVRPELRERFLREARTAAKLSHPNVVAIHRADIVGDFVFFVMAYVEGETLGQRVRARGPLPPAYAARVLREVTWALAYAHARGVIHRDIKPDNILLDRDSGRALVTDFGIALRSDAAGLTEEGNVMGTAQFMSPEQAAGEPLDGRSDLYALGILGHFALTGGLPFDGPTVQTILAKHLTQTPPSLTGLPGIPTDLARALDRCLAKSPADRWPTGEALADAISDATPDPRVVPAPIRVWISKGTWMGPAAAFWYLLLVATLFNSEGMSWGSLVAWLLPLIAYLLAAVPLLRRAFAAGYGYEDLIAGLNQDMADKREERLFDVGQEPPILFRLIRWITLGSYAAFAALFVSVVLLPPALSPQAFFDALAPAIGWVIATAVVGTGFGLMFPGRRLGADDLWGDLRLRFWEGPLGRSLVRFGSVGVQTGPRAIDAHRPTELAIGMAAIDLLKSLPRDLRQRFKGLPRMVATLEREAQELRARLGRLEASAAAVIGPSGQVDHPDRARLTDELTAARAQTQKRLSAVLAALESIRLDLLRLSAGVGDPESLTRAMALAQQVGDDVDALLGTPTAFGAP
jgi:serine/threonine-protein kinase